jgi:phage portal protein BeeE
MADNHFIPNSLNAKGKPSWPIRAFRKLATRIDPEIFTQEQGITFDRHGLRKSVGGKFADIGSESNQFAMYNPSNSTTIDSARAMANHKGIVYAAVNAIAREVMNIDWRLFEDKGDSPEEQTSHAVLDLLDSVNDCLTGLELKYLLSAHMYLAGNAYWYLEGVTDELSVPKAIHLMDPSKVRPVIDRRSWPYQLVGYRMKLENREVVFKPYEVLHFRNPNPNNQFEGMSPVQAGAEYIDNDNYAMDFNRRFFVSGARPAGFLKSDFNAETQLETLRISFANMHETKQLEKVLEEVGKKTAERKPRRSDH